MTLRPNRSKISARSSSAIPPSRVGNLDGQRPRQHRFSQKRSPILRCVGESFRAFPTKFVGLLRTASQSVRTMGMPGIASNQRDMPFFMARSRSAVALTAFMAVDDIELPRLRFCALPDSTRAISMMLLTMPRSTLLSVSLTSSTARAAVFVGRALLFGALPNVCKGDDRGERRFQFVADEGEKIRFGRIVFFEASVRFGRQGR